jgi:hypothetical protein
LSLAINSSLDLKEIFTFSMQKLSQMFEAEIVALLLLNRINKTWSSTSPLIWVSNFLLPWTILPLLGQPPLLKSKFLNWSPPSWLKITLPWE